MSKSAAPKEKPEERLEAIRKRVAKAPEDPGIYRWLGEDGTVLYVGKAKNLRNRLKSYVNGDGHSHGPWKQSFLKQIADFQVTITNSELEALIFETNLIKELRPKYNVLMKDDKNYVYARISTHEPYPRVELVRKIEEKDKAEYFGPMLSGGELWHTLTLLRRVFPFRNCKMEIVPGIWDLGSGIGQKEQPDERSQITGPRLPTEEKSLRIPVVCTHKDRPTPCLDYHIQQCVGPCIGTVTPEEYKRDVIDGIIRFLKGDYAYVGQVLKVRMKQAALERKFELAATLRDQLETIDRLAGKQVVSDTTGEDVDAIAIAVRGGRAHVVVMQKRSGKLIGDEHFALSGETEEPATVLSQFLTQYYEERAVPPTVLVSEELEDAEILSSWFRERRGTKVMLTVPSRGLKSQLLKLAEKNVAEKARQHEHAWEAKKRNTENALAGLQSALNLPKPPERIECYDISHLGGTETVASMTVAIKGELNPKHYRSFHVRSLRSGDVDDYKSLQEALTRRCRRLKDDLPEELKRLESIGIEIGKAKKAERASLEELITKDQLKGVDWADVFVARQDEAIVGWVALRKHKTGLLQFLGPWVQDRLTKERLGTSLSRSLLKTVKKSKVYVICPSEREEEYGELGFRYVQKTPPVLDKLIKKEKILNCPVLMREPSSGKIDPSFSAMPDLLVIDGGKGQVSAVASVLDQFGLSIPLIGLAKREEEIFTRDVSDPISIPSDSPAKFLLMRLRDEAHRFANAGREVRAKRDAVRSALDELPGIGDSTRTALLKKFGSVSGIQAASDGELLEVVSTSQLQMLREKL